MALARLVSKKNLLLDPNRNPSVQLPTVEMDSFGDTVIVIKDQQEFENRVMAAVKRMGDVFFLEIFNIIQCWIEWTRVLSRKIV